MQDNDEVLLKRIANGDDSALETLIKNYQNHLVNFFFRLAYDRDVAQDLAQEVFIKVIAALPKKPPGIPFAVLLFRTGKIHWYSFLRKKYRTVKVFGKIEEYSDMFSASAPVSDRFDDDEKKVHIQAMYKAMEGLPPEQRLVLDLSYFMEVPYKQIAEILEIPLGTVKSRINTAIRKLRSLMETVDDDK